MSSGINKPVLPGIYLPQQPSDEFMIYKAENEKFRLKIFIDKYPRNPRVHYAVLGTIVCGHEYFRLGDKQVTTKLYSSWYEWLEKEVLESNGGVDKVVFFPLYMYDHGLITDVSFFNCPQESGQIGWIYCTKKMFRKITKYTDNELFGTNSKRMPKIGEHVKIKGMEDRGWATILSFGKNYSKPEVIIDFETGKPEDIITASLVDAPDEEFVVTEVMANQAVKILENEIKMYNAYLRGNVYWFTLEKKEFTSELCNYNEVCSHQGFYGEEQAKLWIAKYLPLEARVLLDNFCE